MSRRIFISYHHKDQMKAKGFNLLKWNKNVDIDFVGRHLLDPVNSTNRRYIQGKVLERLAGTSVTIVIVGKDTYKSHWVKWEIEQSLEKGNGILAIKLDDSYSLPINSQVGGALDEAGAEIIGWDPHSFNDAIERAAIGTGRIKSIKATVHTGITCSK